MEDTKNVIKRLATKSCELDPLPTHFLKDNINTVAPTICHIINSSLQEGKFPDDLKEAVVRPLLKKPGLAISEHSNYRPVSNLAFLGKVIEKAASDQIVNYSRTTGNIEKYQSAYTEYHSTETALLDVMNNVHSEVDSGRVVLLVLLDLSAAFDTVKHDLLLERLLYCFGIGETVATIYD